MISVAPLLTDLYQLTMAHVYFEEGMDDIAVFEMAVRRLPPTRRFLIATGLEQVLEYLEQLRFSPSDLAYLQSLGNFPQPFLDHLANLRFTGSVHAMPEGTAFFANEPILRITAPIAEAQLVESRLLNIMHFQTLIASKAARCMFAADGRRLVDFGMRRAHEADAALYAARASYVAGFDGTATVEAGRRFGIPLVGTMAHSFIEAHDNEEEAFRHFIATRPESVTLLIDTYDARRGAQRVVALARELESHGKPPAIRSVRIDSGDLAKTSRAVRKILDEAGYEKIQILLSGGLNENSIEQLVREGAPADGFGVGTSLDASDDAPTLDMAYKLQHYAGRPRRKRSPSKISLPGAKQVFRERDAGGLLGIDRIVLDGEHADGSPLLAEMMRNGKRIVKKLALEQTRAYCAAELKALPPVLRDLRETHERTLFPVEVSVAMNELIAQMDAAGD